MGYVAGPHWLTEKSAKSILLQVFPGPCRTFHRQNGHCRILSPHGAEKAPDLCFFSHIALFGPEKINQSDCKRFQRSYSIFHRQNGRCRILSPHEADKGSCLILLAPYRSFWPQKSGYSPVSEPKSTLFLFNI